MKNALKMMLSYLLFLVIGILVGIVIIVEFLATVGLIAGRTQTLFAGDIFMRAFFIVAPVIIVGSGTFLALYAVRHHAKKVIAAITYIFLCALTWGIVFPAFLIFAKSNTFLTQVESVENLAEINDEPLSKNYFRKAGKFIYYITNEFDNSNNAVAINPETGLVEKEIDSVVIYIDGTHPEMMMYEVSNVSEILKEQAEPFTDILIRDTMSYELLPEFYRSFDFLMKNAIDAWEGGIIHWIFFASLGVALCSVYAFIGMSRWRIINTLSVIMATVFIMICNYLYLIGIFPAINIPWGGVFDQIKHPLLALANFGVAAVFIIFSLIVSLVRSVKNRNRV